MGLSGNYVFFSPLYNFKLIRFNIPVYMYKYGIKYIILPRPIREWLILRRDHISRYLVVI